jgi:photosystem II stability/assembly factor-like uncharacterized protein
MIKLRLGLAVALGSLALLAAMPAASYLAGRAADQGSTTIAPTVHVTPGLGSRAWFVSRDVGWVLVKVPTTALPRMELYRTPDAGDTWQRQLTWAGGAAPEAARFFGPTQAFFTARVDAATLSIFTTLDGSRWRSGASPSPAAAVSFVDANLGWAAYRQGAGVAVDRSGDGGRTWRRLITFTAPPEVDPRRWFEFTDTQNGLMGGLAEGKLAPLYATHDGGTTWRAAALPAPPEHVGAAASSVVAGARSLAGGTVVVSLSIYPREGQGYARSYLYASADGGRTWSNPRALPGAEWQALDQRHVVAISGRDLFTSGDGGQTWRRTQASLPAARSTDRAAFDAFRFAGPAFLAGPAGWATLVTRQRCQGASRPQTCAEHPEVAWAIARTADGGSTWSLVDAHA